MAMDPMLELARNVAEFAHKTETEPKNNLSLSFCIATVRGYENGKIRVQRPFDDTILSLRFVPSAGNLAVNTPCFVLICGSMSNAIVLGDAALQNL